MRRILWLLSFLLLNLTFAAHAVPLKRVSVAEFEQLLSEVKGQQDGKVSKLVSGLELTQRASAVRLARWQSEFPGRHSQEAFMVLSDSSAFYDLPADEIPATAPPDMQTQKAILARTIDYVQTAINRLPDFYATRKTENYQDLQGRLDSYNRTPGQTSLAGLDPKVIPHEPLLDAGKSSLMVRYVDGREVLGTKKNDESVGDPTNTLTTHGEFGPILAVILEDAVKNKIYWGHWEQGTAGTSAVFRYWVQLGQSGYQVMIPGINRNEKAYPAYHGEIGVDPATGAVLRITVIADFPPPNQQGASSILVEYGSVVIGGKSFICPVHSVALARFAVPDALGPVNRIDTVVATRFKTELNDVAFVEYHQFRAESRILVDNPIDTPEPPAPHK
jgi:hypothetical protein